MKKYLTIALAMCLLGAVQAQVEMGKTKNSMSGKSKLLALKTDKMMLDNFNINLILYSFAEDQGGGGAQVGIRANLVEIDEALAQSIANEAYAYFQEKWQERGVEVYSPTKEEIEATKKYSKQSKKGNANITSGGVWDNASKKNHNMMAWPEGTNIANSGSGPMAVSGNAVHVVPDYKGQFFYTGFTTTVNFIEFKTAALGSTASVKTFPQLKAGSTLSVQIWEKTKVVLYGASNGAEGIEDFYSDVSKDEVGALNSSLNMWNYIADKEKFKANVMEMIKKSMDDQFADYDTQVAEQG